MFDSGHWNDFKLFVLIEKLVFIVTTISPLAHTPVMSGGY